MSAILRRAEHGYLFWCPGCQHAHAVYTTHPTGFNWNFNKNEEAPTFAPSLLLRWTEPSGAKCCHLYIRDGQLQFLGDCTHSLAGKTVPMAPFPTSAV